MKLYLDDELFMELGINSESAIMLMYDFLIESGRNVKLVIDKR